MTPPSNILLITEGQVGDLLLLTPAIRALSESYPFARITLLIVERRDTGSARGIQGELLGPAKDTILSTNPRVHHIYSVRRDYLRMLSGARRLGAERRIIRFVREKRYDTVICTFPEDRFALWAFASGARVRVGERRQGLGWVFTHTPDVRKEDRGVLEYYRSLVRTVGAVPDNAGPEYHIRPDAEEWAQGFLQDHGLLPGAYVAVHPGATGDYKIWPPERYAALIDRITDETSLPAVLCTGPQDGDVYARVRESLRSAVVPLNTAGRIDRLAAVLAHAALVISNDSGPRHLSIAVGTPSLAFFRRHHDREWGVYPESATVRTLKSTIDCPLCPAGICHDRTTDGQRYGAACMMDISVETALKLTLVMLGRTSDTPS
jgi:heptosyltransferase-3